MAGFENIVRPVVFPNIRPSPAQSVPAATAPDQGVAKIHGGSGKSVDLPHSSEISSQQHSRWKHSAASTRCGFIRWTTTARSTGTISLTWMLRTKSG